MKIKIDTTNKTIHIEEDINLGEFFDKLSVLFGNDAWREYELRVATIYNWVNPITIPWPTTPINPIVPIYQPDYNPYPTVTCCVNI